MSTEPGEATPAPRSRRHEYSDATRAALVESATRLFTERGYATTSLDQVAADARVTKGALYHHFSGKRALFEAVFDVLEQIAVARITGAARSKPDRWDGVLAAIAEYLDLCLGPHGRLVVQQGPVALGWLDWHAQEERYGLGLTQLMIQQLLDEGRIVPVPAETTARVVFGMFLGAAHLIVESDDPEQARNEALSVITLFLEGVRA
jgi:AcrR family transcriptional regulator